MKLELNSFFRQVRGGLPNKHVRQWCCARTFLFICGVLLLHGVCVSPAMSQSFKATVVGEVRDSNEAAIAGATVTITETATGRTQTVTTTEEGSFTIPQLTPGGYTLRVEASNFKSVEQQNLVLETDATERVNITLQAGSVQEVVTVEAGATSVINSETPSKGEVIVEKQITESPLNGRNFLDLAQLVPGVYQRLENDFDGQGAPTNGTRSDSTNFILDGVSNRSDKSGGEGVTTSVDSIQEFRVETSTYAAQYGRTAGAQINVVGKSGTNRYSGSLFEFHRNDVFDANNFFALPEQPKKLLRNQFGGTLGGPLSLPNFGEGGSVFRSGRDRTFFFLSYEGSREVRSVFARTTAPNESWLRGDFRNVRGAGANGVLGDADDTNRILNPFNRDGSGRQGEFRIPNVIDSELISPVSRQILPFIPTANVPGTIDQYSVQDDSATNRDLFSVKVTHNFSQNNTFFGRYASQRNDNFLPNPGTAGGFYPGFGSVQPGKTDSLAFSDTHIFTPTIVNEVRFGFTNGNNPQGLENANTDFSSLFGIQGVNAGAVNQGFPTLRIDGFPQFGDRENLPQFPRSRNFQIFDLLSLVRGNQNIKIGVDIIRSRYVEDNNPNVRGNFRFSGRATNPRPTTGISQISGGARSFADFLLGQLEQSLRASPADTPILNGTQYAFFVQNDYRVRPWLTLNLGLRYELQTPLTEANNNLANFIPELAQLVVAGDERFSASFLKTDNNNFEPRVGFALRPFSDDKTVVRGGFGIFHNLSSFNNVRQQLVAVAPFVLTEEYNRLNGNVVTADSLLNFSNPFPEQLRREQGVTTPRGADLENDTPEFYQYNLTVERELVGGLALEVGYIGSQGRHLSRRYDLNSLLPTGAVTSTITDGVTTFTPISARRFPQFGTINYQENSAISNYNSMQAALRTRATRGLTLLTSYTFSRSIDEGSAANASGLGVQTLAQDPRNFRLERGLSDFHRKHKFSTIFNYELPFGRDKAFFNEGGIAQAILGGFQINGVVSLQSGRPFTPRFTAASIGQQRPDIVGDPYEGIPDGLFFNPDAFARPVASPADPDFFGNAGRNILIGPSFKNLDFSLLRRFRLRERTSLQFRAEAFNVLNNTNFQVPNFTLGLSDVGRFTRTSNQNRELQFALRLTF